MDVNVKDDCSWQPSGRQGACCFSHDGAVYVFQGQDREALVAPRVEPCILYRFLLKEGRWDSAITTAPSTCTEAVNGAISGSCCCLLGRPGYECLVTFGGWNAGLRVADVHKLDLDNMSWSKCDVVNPADGPFLKDKAGMIPYGNNMVCVVGGYGYPSPHHFHQGIYQGQKGAQYHWDYYHDLCWTNEVHLFYFDTGKWISPQMSGQRPPPCAAFSFTMADSCRAVMFGGRQRETRVDHIYILHLDTWHWEGAYLNTSPNEPWPTSRSFHTACSLNEPSLISTVSCSVSDCSSFYHKTRFDWLPCASPDLLPSHPSPVLRPRLLILWGMDIAGDPVPDCWILELDPIMWRRIDIPESELCHPRLWHVAGVFHPTPSEAEVVVFGGSKMNLFIPAACCVSDTVVFNCGVSSLYSLCVRYLSLLPDAALASLPSIIPTHVVQQIVQQVAANKNYCNFPPIRL